MNIDWIGAPRAALVGFDLAQRIHSYHNDFTSLALPETHTTLAQHSPWLCKLYPSTLKMLFKAIFGLGLLFNLYEDAAHCPKKPVLRPLSSIFRAETTEQALRGRGQDRLKSNPQTSRKAAGQTLREFHYRLRCVRSDPA
jgi:hypothetical protein